MASKTDKLVEAVSTKKKRKNKGFRASVNSVCEFMADVARFVFFAAVVGAGYVLATQGSVNMRVIGSVLLAGGVIFFASKTLNK